MSDAAFRDHDHAHCAAPALAEAEATAKARGLRLTPVRRRVLEILLEDHRALGAYDILARLKEDGFGDKPPVAYRALDFLVENGLAHRIQRLNAFTACLHIGEDHAPAFFICEVCQSVAEAPEPLVDQAIDSAASQLGFSVSRTSVEVLGRCPNCPDQRP